MSTNDKDRIENHVVEVANRLRLIRADLADESDQIRRGRLSEELEKELATISSAERDEFMRRLLERFLADDFAGPPEAKAGLSLETGQHDFIDLGQELKAELQISGDLNLSARKLAELTTMLVEFVLKLEPLVWNTWRALSPRSGIRPQGSLAKKIEQFLREDAEASGALVGEDLKVLQRLIAALATAVSVL